MSSLSSDLLCLNLHRDRGAVTPAYLSAMVFVTSAAFRLVVVIIAAAIPVVQGVQKALEFCHPKKDR